jgi:phosphoglycerate kinase
MLAPLFTLYVNDAFPTCHRNQPSIVGFPEVLPAAAGRTLEKELKALGKILNSVEHPSTYLLGGVKVKERLGVLERMLKDGKVDHVLVTGLLAEIFLNVNGVDLGSVNKEKMRGHEKDLEKAKELLRKYAGKIQLPQDVAVEEKGRRVEQALKTPPKGKIMDIGEKTLEEYTSILKSSKTIVANGPAGVFEREEFAHGTQELLKTMAHSKAYTVIGGGHLGSLTDTYNLRDDFDHISTGGGAMLQFLAEGNLPGIEALERAAKRSRGAGKENSS